MIYIIIPVHNRKAYTRQCLASLHRQTYAYFSVVVVDDGSTDGTSAMIKAEFPEVVVLAGTGSLWWAGATNLGIQYALDRMPADADHFVLTLNDDTQVPPDYLTSLVDAWQSNKPCVVGSISVDIHQPDQLLYAGTRLNWFTARFTDLARIMYQNRLSQLKATNQPAIDSDSLPGRGMLIHRSVISTVGLFDAHHFPQYLADLDFSIRARRAGFPLRVSVNSLVYEHTETTGLSMDKARSWRSFWDSLFSVRSPVQLRIRYHFARLHAPNVPLFLLADLGRVLGGYLVRRVRR